MSKNKSLEFKATIQKSVYSTDTFCIYSAKADEKYNLSKNGYGSITIVGDLPSLVVGREYEFKGEETKGKYGIQYKCNYAIAKTPVIGEGVLEFLKTCTSDNLAEELYKHYPNVVELIMDNKTEQIDLSKVKGVGDKIFDTIAEKVKSHYSIMGLVAKYKGMISMTVLNGLFKAYGSNDGIMSSMEKDAYKCLCNVSRVGFKKADAIVLELSDSGIVKEGMRESIERMRACISYCLSENEMNGDTNIKIMDLRKMCGDMTPECIHLFPMAIKDEYSDYFVSDDGTKAGIRSTHTKENYIYNKIIEMAEASGVSKDKWRYNLENYRSVDGFDLTDEQMGTIRELQKGNIAMLIGSGGMGKSASALALINICRDKGIDFKLCSPTGKASKVLADYTGAEASTIHRLLKYNPNAKPNESKFEFNEKNKLDTDLIVIDEFSMVDVNLMNDLLKAVDITKTKLLIIGDDAQIPSVGCGNLLYDFQKIKCIPIVRLTKVFRYKEGGLSKVATDIRNGQKFLGEDPISGSVAFGKNKDFIFTNAVSTDNVKKEVLRFFTLMTKKNDISDVAVMCSQNTGDLGTKELNKVLQKQYLGKRYSEDKFIVAPNFRYYRGDKVIQMKNNYKAKPYNSLDESQEVAVFNGNTGVVESIIDEDSMVIDFDGNRVVYNRDDMNSISLGYCTTIHKMQGSQARYIIVVTPKQHTFMLNSNLIYTGVSRASKSCVMIGNKETVDKSIKKKINMKRKTWCEDFIKTI